MFKQTYFPCQLLAYAYKSSIVYQKNFPCTKANYNHEEINVKTKGMVNPTHIYYWLHVRSKSTKSYVRLGQFLLATGTNDSRSLEIKG